MERSGLRIPLPIAKVVAFRFCLRKDSVRRCRLFQPPIAANFGRGEGQNHGIRGFRLWPLSLAESPATFFALWRSNIEHRFTFFAHGPKIFAWDRQNIARDPKNFACEAKIIARDHVFIARVRYFSRRDRKKWARDRKFSLIDRKLSLVVDILSAWSDIFGLRFV